MTPAPAPETQSPAEDSEQQYSDPTDYGYGPNNEELPDQLVGALKFAIKHYAGQDVYVRRREVLADRKNRFYERGYQHIYCNENTGGFTQGTAGSMITVGTQQIQCPEYIGDYNIFLPYERIIQSVLTQNPPGIDFRPISDSAEDNESAKTAEGYREMFRRSNVEKDIQKEIVRMLCLSGRTVLWTRTEANGPKWGYNADGSAKKMEVCSVFGTLESRVPILAKCLEDAPYVFLFDEPDVLAAKEQYPAFKDQIKESMCSIAETAYERTARLGVLQGSRSLAQLGDSFSHLVTRAHCWLRPASFQGEYYDEPLEFPAPTGDAQTVGDELRRLATSQDSGAPVGICVRIVGDTYVGSYCESPDDALAIGWPYVGDGMYRPAIMGPMIIVQDDFNDDLNYARETWAFGAPSTWLNMEQEDIDAISDQRADPYCFRPMKLRPGEKMADQMSREPQPEIPATLIQLIEMLQGPLPQFMLACPPAVFGEAMPDQKTASGYHLAASQALGQQGVWFGVIQQLMARMYYQAALCASKNPDHAEEIVIPGTDGSKINLQLAKLSKGKFGAYPDEDSAFPESMQQKRAVLEGIFAMAAQNPAVGMQVMGSPDNWKTFLTVLGMPEIQIPEAEARDKQVFEIEQLLQQSPLPPSPQELMAAQQQHAAESIAAQVSGQPEQPFQPPQAQTSISVQLLDFHAWEFAKCQEWLSSDACRQQLAQGNYPGVMNVRLHAMQHQQMMAALAPPPMPAAPSGPGGPPKPAKPAPSSPPSAPPANAAPTAPMPMPGV